MATKIGLCQDESRNSIQVAYVAGMGTSTWTITRSLPGTSAGNWIACFTSGTWARSPVGNVKVMLLPAMLATRFHFFLNLLQRIFLYMGRNYNDFSNSWNLIVLIIHLLFFQVLLGINFFLHIHLSFIISFLFPYSRNLGFWFGLHWLCIHSEKIGILIVLGGQLHQHGLSFCLFLNFPALCFMFFSF